MGEKYAKDAVDAMNLNFISTPGHVMNPQKYFRPNYAGALLSTCSGEAFSLGLCDCAAMGMGAIGSDWAERPRILRHNPHYCWGAVVHINNGKISPDNVGIAIRDDMDNTTPENWSRMSFLAICDRFFRVVLSISVRTDYDAELGIEASTDAVLKFYTL